MTDLIAAFILILITGGAVFYIIKAKRKGTKCIGCPAGGKCPGSCSTSRKGGGTAPTSAGSKAR